MILSRGRGYLFIHIPKTGGTSMALALEARAKADDLMAGDTPKAAKRRRKLRDIKTAGRLWKHSTVADLDGLLNPGEAGDLFVFTLVRNPWDRMVSYYHWLRTQTFNHPAVQLAQSVEFSRFLNHPITERAFLTSPYSSYVTDQSGREVCSAYVRLENLAEDLAPVEAHMGFKLEIPHVNRSERKADYRDAYTDSDRAQLARLCAADIEKFGYRF